MKPRPHEPWDFVPVRVLAWPFGVAGLLALLGIVIPAASTASALVFGVAAFCLGAYGLIGLWVKPFEQGLHAGLLNLILPPPLNAILQLLTHSEDSWGSFLNMVVGFGLLWLGTRLYPLYSTQPPVPVAPTKPVAGGDALTALEPGGGGQDPPEAAAVVATIEALTRLLASVTDEPSALRAKVKYATLVSRRRADFAAAGQAKALDDEGNLVSLTALITLGSRFREVNRRYEAEWKRIRSAPGLAKALGPVR